MTHSTKPHFNRSTTAHGIAKVLQSFGSVREQAIQWRRRHLMVAAGRAPRPRPHPSWPRHACTTRATRLPSLFPLVLAPVADFTGVRRKNDDHRGSSTTMPTRSSHASSSHCATTLPETSRIAWRPQESPGKRHLAGIQCALEDTADTAERRGRRRAAS